MASQEGGNLVRLAYMEFAEPTLMDMAAEAIREGVGAIWILPLFLAGGAHVSNDIPDQVGAVRERYPHLEVEILPPIGEDPSFKALLRSIVGRACREVARNGRVTPSGKDC
jgi:sirohydrochlorin cobaltochelatase